MGSDEARTRQARGGLFVGRTRELTELAGAAARARAGRGSLVLLAGEAGVGKTRILERFVDNENGGVLLSLWGRCWEEDGAPAFWPWIQILRGLAKEGMLAPGVESVLDTLRPREGSEGLGDHTRSLLEGRFRVFDELWTLLDRAAAARPLILVFDDLHWADPASLVLLRFVAREAQHGSVLVLGTLRPTEIQGDERSRAFTALASESRRIDIEGLGDAEVEELMAAVTGTRPERRMVDATMEATGGNPLFVIELGREGKRGSAIPRSLRPIIASRLARLPAGCRALLEVASVLGREFDETVLSVLAGRTSAAVADDLRRAARSGLIDAPDAAGRRYRFAHALVRDALYDEVEASRRRELHGRAGTILEQMHGGDAPAPAAEIAHQFRNALPDGQAERAIRWSERAALAATASFAYEEAERQLEAALAALPPGGRAEVRCRLLLALGEARAACSETEAARASFRQAAHLARSLRSAELLARAALGPTKLPVGIGVVDPEQIRLLDEALACVSTEEDDLRARLLGALAAELRWSDRAAASESLSRQALEIAQRLGDEPTLTGVLVTTHWARWGPQNAAERVDNAGEIVRLAERTGDMEIAAIGHTWRAAALLDSGEVAAADVEIRAVSHAAEAIRHPTVRWWLAGLQAARALLQGRFAEAEERAEAGLEIGRRVHEWDAVQTYGAQLLTLRVLQGRIGDLDATFPSLDDHVSAVPAWRCARAMIHAAAGQHLDARIELDRLMAHGLDDLPRDQQWLPSIAMLSEVASTLGDVERARVLYEALLPYASWNVMAGSATAPVGPAAHYLGLLATQIGDWDTARDHFGEAMALAARMGARPYLVRTEIAYARFLSRRDPGARTRVPSLCRDAMDLSEALGMAGTLAEARALAADAEGAKGTETVSQNVSRRTAECRFALEGEYWSISFGERTVRLRSSKGLRYIARLLGEPGRGFHVAELAASDPSFDARGDERRGRAALAVPDERARHQYRERLSALREQAEQAERMNEPERARLLGEEIEALVMELGRRYAVSHPRQRDAAAERLRKAVRGCIRDALRKLEQVHPSLWRHLYSSLRTGTFCSYRPEVDVRWDVLER